MDNEIPGFKGAKVNGGSNAAAATATAAAEDQGKITPRSNDFNDEDDQVPIYLSAVVIEKEFIEKIKNRYTKELSLFLLHSALCT